MGDSGYSPYTFDAFDLALVLVQQSDSVDQGEIFLVIAPGARLLVEEGQLLSVRIDHGQGSQQALRILVLLDDLLGGIACQQPLQGSGLGWRCWIAAVCSRDSLMVSTTQRFSNSSSMSMAVVVRNSITGPSTRYSSVTNLPDSGSLPVHP
jgi:hypothetical protein